MGRREDFETRDEEGAAAFEWDNTWPEDKPDLRDVWEADHG
jgi:hypothetical protein